VTARIKALAAGPGTARVGRVAIVTIGAAQTNGYRVLAWGDRFD
jgi:hypothetical protein